MKRFKEFLEEKEEKVSENIKKIIKLFKLKRRPGEKRVFFEASGVGNINDDQMIRKIVSDFKIDSKCNSPSAWCGFSKSELFEVDYTEGDIYLIVFKNDKELEAARKKAIAFAKENW